ncbi:MAG TPA: D-alanyl-lipoteichoic acid biosynthesis protein DltB, partial [Anaerolineales bacterium]
MIPYTNFLYFGISLYVAIPSLALGFARRLAPRLSQAWIVLATAFMLVIQYATWQKVSARGAVLALWLVIGYALYEYLLAAGFLALRLRRASRPVYYLVLLLALLPLALSRLLPLVSPDSAVWFLGISYLTFRCLDVIICIQDQLISALPPVQFLAFLLFFPTLSSGPIDRYRRFADDWRRDRTRPEVLRDLDQAVHHIFNGFLYKFILAALLQTYVLAPLAVGNQLGRILGYMYAYSFYLFFDFAGYSAFAVGFSYLFGIYTPENFNRPFLAPNIQEFWNRWHMSLSFWFRDHVYSRFVFSALKGRWFKNPRTASYLGFFLSMGLMGVWHGLAARYIFYGLYHAILLVSHDWLSRWNKQKRL